MVEKARGLNFLAYVVLILGILVVGFPIYISFVAASHDVSVFVSGQIPLLPGPHLIENISYAWTHGDLGSQIINSLIIAGGITLGKISISILAAFAITYFDFKFRQTAFWIVFITLMLPVEVRIVPTYQVVADIFSPVNTILGLFGLHMNFSLSLLDSYFGLTVPLIASATATFLFRQFFLTVPDELAEASKIDGASPMTFFRKILFPLSKTNIAALTVITFVFGWNQYLWPLLITTDAKMRPIMVGIKQLIPAPDDPPTWNIAMAGSLVTILPPILVVVLMQRWFIKGLIENEK
ncbi:MAG TPA: sn-glycerol-3-phosphate ABC transporter permease UgpE [Bdellovibrionota bacterium]|jgi:sn-glycerol 3-phosphate transport system permease protein|nr:sn-glycerol-3-phosphate ABC transporter permease UgpE [Bdellovibrionota bacterium]